MFVVMKNIFIYIFCILLFSNAKCKKECHSEVLIINNSNQDIISALKINDPNGNCVLSGEVIKVGELDKRSTRGCWEKKLINGVNFEFYLVDPVKYNTTNVFYNCDSIELKNKILKYYSLTLDDLKKSNFTVHYP